MRNIKYIRRVTLSAVFGGLLMAGAAVSATAQNSNEEYREWQRAQNKAREEHQEYLRSRSRSDYREWQEAQREAQEEYREYQAASNRGGRYNRGYNTGYNDNNRRYRVYRNGSYYSTDSRGAELLRQAVRNGYSQGYRQGQLDNQYGRGSAYNRNSIYRSGTYGWQSHVARNQYQYYFQQGFQRGYDDGYSNSYRYGERSGNGFNILGSVLNTILNFAD